MNGETSSEWGGGFGLIVLILLFLGIGGNGIGGLGGGQGYPGVPNVPVTSDQFQSGQNFQNINTNMSALETNLVQGFNLIQRDNADLKMQLCNCCNDIQTQMATGFGATQLAACQNTNQLLLNQNANTQKILDSISDGRLADAERDNSILRSQLSTANLEAYIAANCTGCSASSRTTSGS